MHCHTARNPHSEASCVSQIRTARAVAEELGEATAVRSGVQRWAKVSFDHSERGVHKIVSDQGTKLDLPITSLQLGEDSIPWIDPRSWVQYIVDQGLCSMFAGVTGKQKYLAPGIWRDFWSKFEKMNPHHEVFTLDNMDWGKTIGLYIHGDEGRTLKKSGLMVTSIQSVLGKGFDNKRLKRDVSGCVKAEVNFAGHTFTTRFVSFVIPKTLYDKKPGIYLEVLGCYAKSLRSLLDDGVYCRHTRETYRFVVIGCKGDLPYLAKAGLLKRTFNTAAKRGSSDKVHGVCHLCLAGLPDYPAEDLANDRPAWLRTVAVQVPWRQTPPFLKFLMHDLNDPASFFACDLWHCVHLGFGRSWVASIVNLSLAVLPFSNLDQKWDFLSRHYITWCRLNKKQSHVSKITPFLMSYDDTTGKQGRWHKGALTTNLCHWVVQLLADIPQDDAGFLNKCTEATTSLNLMFSCFYRSSFWLSREECLYTSQKGLHFLRVYAYLAGKQYELNRSSLFPLYPKLHFMHHCMLKLQSDAHGIGFSQNPISTVCQMDEDAIGRVSRLSRKVSIRATMQRTMERYVVACYTAWTAAGLIKWFNLDRDVRGGAIKCLLWEMQILLWLHFSIPLILRIVIITIYHDLISISLTASFWYTWFLVKKAGYFQQP